MDDLDRGRPVAQHGERVEQPLHSVVALDERLQVDLGADAVALVVDDEVRAVCLERQQVDHAVISGSLAASEKANGCSRRTLPAAASRAASSASQRAGDQRRPSRSRSPRRPRAMPSSRAAVGHLRARRRLRTGEVEQLQQPVHERPARTRLEPFLAARGLAPPRDPRASRALVPGSSDSRSARARSASCS